MRKQLDRRELDIKQLKCEKSALEARIQQKDKNIEKQDIEIDKMR